MIIRCNACGFVNGAADEETAYCPNCGAPYAADEGATVMAGPPPARGNSYGGYTPYPTQAPEYMPTPPPFSTSPTPYPYGDKTAFGPPPPPPKRKGGLGPFVGGMLVMLGLVVLALCGLAAYAAAKAHNNGDTTLAQTGSGTSPTTNTGKNATTSLPAFLHYSDPQGQFTINYPVTWHYQAASNPGFSGTLTTFTPADTTAKAFDVAVTPVFLTTTSLEKIIAGNNGTNIVQTEKPVTVTYNGIHWRKVAANFTASDGATYHAVELVWHHAPGTYLIVFYAPLGQFDATWNAVFLPMTQSFTAA